MADSNGHDRLAKAEEIIAALLEHARVTDQKQDWQDRQIEALRDSVRETNASLQSLVGAIRDLIDRIPPDRL